MNDLIKHKLELLPNNPGCYLHKDKFGNIIYVGKAKNLKNRVRSYFRGSHDTKTELLVSEIADFEFIVTESNIEALLLEINLIQENMPKFNIRLKDDKSYPFIKITKELYPRLLITRQVKKDGGLYFGPYPDSGAATQRPSVDVISGLIKANVPSRVAFAVSSGTDSRTILDENGAEKLLGRGDMLFKPIDENHPVRLQGSFISDDDVERIVTFIKDQASADYDESFDPGEVSENDFGGGSSANGGSSEGDPLFEEAKALVLETQKASASMIQRRLSVGFNRATRLMEELEEAGVIGPAEGTKPRKVLMTQE